MLFRDKKLEISSLQTRNFELRNAKFRVSKLKSEFRNAKFFRFETQNFEFVNSKEEN